MFTLLRFAKNWDIPKFVYGTSFGVQKWTYNKKDELIAKIFELIKIIKYETY